MATLWGEFESDESGDIGDIGDVDMEPTTSDDSVRFYTSDTNALDQRNGNDGTDKHDYGMDPLVLHTIELLQYLRHARSQDDIPLSVPVPQKRDRQRPSFG